MKTTLLSFAALLVFCSVAGHTDAAPFTYNSGTTLASPTFNRPLAGTPPSGLSGVGTAVHYDLLTFSVDTAGSYVFQELSIAPANWDNFTVLYQNTFNPASPLTNALVANDDNPTIGTSGFTITLAASTTYRFISTGFQNTDVGTFGLTVNGPGNVIAAAIPEPSTYVMMAGGVGLLLLGQHFRRSARSV